MINLWGGTNPLNYQNPNEIKNVEYHMILDTVKTLHDKYFIHGIAVEMHRGALFTTWAFNPNRENVTGERCVGKISRDGGKTWGEDFEILPHDRERSASHGSLFEKDGVLYALVPVADFKGTSDWTVWDVDTELYVYDDDEKYFKYVATPMKNFWCLSRPENCTNGNLVVAGLGKGRSRIAVCTGNFEEWTVVAPEIDSPETSFSESAQYVQNNTVTVVSRNDNKLSPDTIGTVQDGRYRLAAARSEDGGITYTKMEETDIFASPSKPFAGVLKDGRPFLIFDQIMENNNARRRLMLLVGEAGSLTFSKEYMLDFRMGALSYPFATEHDGKLYIVYSSSIGDRVDGNKNNLKIAIVDTKEI